MTYEAEKTETGYRWCGLVGEGETAFHDLCREMRAAGVPDGPMTSAGLRTSSIWETASLTVAEGINHGPKHMKYVSPEKVREAFAKRMEAGE